MARKPAIEHADLARRPGIARPRRCGWPLFCRRERGTLYVNLEEAGLRGKRRSTARANAGKRRCWRVVRVRAVV